MCIVFLLLVCLRQKITMVLIEWQGLLGLRVSKPGRGGEGTEGGWSLSAEAASAWS